MARQWGSSLPAPAEVALMSGALYLAGKQERYGSGGFRLTDPVSGRGYVLDGAGALRPVSMLPVDKGAVKPLVVAHLRDGLLVPTIRAGRFSGDGHLPAIGRMNEALKGAEVA